MALSHAQEDDLFAHFLGHFPYPSPDQRAPERDLLAEPGALFSQANRQETDHGLGGYLSSQPDRGIANRGHAPPDHIVGTASPPFPGNSKAEANPSGLPSTAHDWRWEQHLQGMPTLPTPALPFVARGSPPEQMVKHSSPVAAATQHPPGRAPSRGPSWESPQSSGRSGDAFDEAGSVAAGRKAAKEEKSFKEVHAERNKQAQRRFRQRQKEKIEELQGKLTVLQTEKAELDSRTQMLTSALQLRQEELKKVRERQAAPVDAEEDELAREFAGAVTLTLREDREVTLSAEQIKSMTDADLARYWSQYVKEVAVLLVAAEGGEARPEVTARMAALVQHELLFLYIRAALVNMGSVKRFVARAKLETVRVSLGSEGLKLWRGVATALQLTDAQRGEIVALWHTFRERLGRLVARRAEIHAELASTLPAGLSCRDYAVQFLKAHEGMEALKRNLRQEHVLIHEFLSMFYAQKLTPIQAARMLVKSWPFYPDVPGITLMLAAQAGDAQALGSLRRIAPKFAAENGFA